MFLALVLGLMGGEDVVVEPDWAQKPSGATAEYYYPKAASWLGIEGKAVIVCRVALDGTLADCVVDSETPPGHGFGAATLAAAKTFRMHPRRVNGRPVADGVVRIPMTFSVPPFDNAALKETARCAGWAQAAVERSAHPPARQVWAFTYWRFAYVAAASRAGHKPSEIAQRLDEAREAAAPRIVRASEQYKECWRTAYSYMPLEVVKAEQEASR
jgi:TonB family protein